MPNRLRKIYLMHQVKEDRVIPLSEITAETGISHNRLLAWIKDETLPRTEPHKRLVRELCKYFRVSPNELLGEKTNE